MESYSQEVDEATKASLWKRLLEDKVEATSEYYRKLSFMMNTFIVSYHTFLWYYNILTNLRLLDGDCHRH
jgi:hypothetical protein